MTSFFSRLGTGAYQWHEVLAELVLIGFAINWCAGVLHGTRGTRLLRGLLIVLVVATLIVRVAADQLGWPRLELLYRYFIIGLAFIALVAFQPELRRALMRAGELGFLRRGKSMDKVIPALSEAAGYLSRNRFGALIAIQRDVGLANWAENGAMLNSEVSADLLKTIFFPNSALHDLGVIIRGNRIVAAGCQFPVAESGETDASLGSRHRAAVGLSQESDALVLIVSEETGTISIADNGKLTRYLALDDLEEELEGRLAAPNSASRSSGKRKLSDLWRVARRLLVVIPLTLVVWFLADQASLVTADDIPLELQFVHESSVVSELVSPPDGRFEIRVRGQRRAVEPLRALNRQTPLEVSVELPRAYHEPGAHQLVGDALRDLLTRSRTLQARGLFVESVRPAMLSFNVDDVVVREVPVRVNSAPLRVDVERIEPPRVLVALPRQRWKTVGESPSILAALGDRIAASPREQALNLTDVPLSTLGEGVAPLRVTPSEVNVRLRIVAEQSTRRFSNVRVLALGGPVLLQRYALDIADVNEWLLEVEVTGDQAVIETMEPTDIRASVNLTSEIALGDEFASLEVRFQLPEGVSIVGPPRVVQVRLTPREGAAP